MSILQIVKKYKEFLGDCVEIKKLLMAFSVSPWILRTEKQLICNMIDQFREQSYDRLEQIDLVDIEHPILNNSRSCLEKYFIKICNLCEIISNKPVIEEFEHSQTNIEEDEPILTSVG